MSTADRPAAGAPTTEPASVDEDVAIARMQAHTFEENESRIAAVDRLAAAAREAETVQAELDHVLDQVAQDHYFARAEVAEAEVKRLRRMVFDHHQSLAAIGGGPCICDVCQAARVEAGT